MFHSEYIDHSPMSARSGGDSGYRRIFFKALAPGECVITMKFEEGPEPGERVSEECTYTIVIKN